MKKFSNLPIKVEENIKLIESDNTSGSIELTRMAVKTIEILVENISAENPDIFKSLVKETALKLVNAQQSMASIFTFANSLLLEIDKSYDAFKIKNIIERHSKRFANHLNNSAIKISQFAQSLIKNDPKIITHSYSSSVLNSLISAKKQGKNFRVICTESRPINEGVIFAKKLGEAGIKVNLVTDAAIYNYIETSDMVIVGGDAIDRGGLVNKIGTLGLAIAAKHFNVDCYSLCGSEKILPIAYNLKIEKKNPGEITFSKIKNVTPINLYFDVTPLELFTGVITELGLKNKNEIQTLIEEKPIHKLFENH